MPAKKRPQATFIMKTTQPPTPAQKTAPKPSKARQSWVPGVTTVAISIILHLILFAMIAFGARHTQHWPEALLGFALVAFLALTIDDGCDRIVRAIRELQDPDTQD